MSHRPRCHCGSPAAMVALAMDPSRRHRVGVLLCGECALAEGWGDRAELVPLVVDPGPPDPPAEHVRHGEPVGMWHRAGKRTRAV